MWFGPSMMMGAPGFQTVTTTYTTSQTITPPAGALYADIECISGGGGGTSTVGGQGGNYAFATITLTGTTLVIGIGAGGAANSDGTATTVTRSGTPVCLANVAFAGGTANTTPGTGSVFRYGGVGLGLGSSPPEKYGGGAAGPNSNGGNAVDNGDGTGSPGSSGGSPAGAGEALYGGGGRGGSGQSGGQQGCVRITFRG